MCFFILPSYETEKSVQRITDTVPYVSAFCQVMKLEISAEDNWYCPLCFYVLPMYETGKSVQQILILSLMFLHFARLWHWKTVQQVTDTVSYVSTFCQVMKLWKSVQQLTDTVPCVSLFCQVMKLLNQCNRKLIPSLMFLHFAKLWNWEISERGNWYCPLCFYILLSYETGDQCSR